MKRGEREEKIKQIVGNKTRRGGKEHKKQRVKQGGKQSIEKKEGQGVWQESFLLTA